MSEKKLRRLPLAAAAMVACMSAQADYQSPDGNFRLSGFGTLGAVQNSTNDVQFNYPGQGGGAGTTASLDADSKLAVQGTYKFTPTISATTQVMTRFDPEAQYVPSVDWLFAKWQALPALSVRGGRMGAPFFMVSDFRNVGYANTTVRPNLDVYGQVPTDQFEGLDATYQYSFDSVTVNATLWGGGAKADYRSAYRKGTTLVDASTFTLKKLKGLNLTAETDNGITLRAGYAKAKIDLTSSSINALVASGNALSTYSASVGPVNSAFQSLGVQALNATSAINVSDGNVSFLAFGASYDQDNWIISGEYTKRRSDNFIADTTGWYANVGYRVGKFTPYLGFSKLTVNSANVSPATVVAATLSAPFNGANAQLAGTALTINESIQGYMNVQKLDQKTITLGTRWDVTSSVAIKAQWDQIHKPADSYGLFFAEDTAAAGTQSFFNSRRKVNVLSVSMDFVF